ncbi:zinc finger CCCH domain-containing protein ZFN-like isoform X3 [Prunus yedoensis var. nudiflora]|uniref:Zinc finger CCCH domain-containing protein ZFN-like isoform X3 n=1 Tax=Prunus yedoensis var. nudiflora TaxID=2094558 RepID=A0A314YLE7_PRUYE|nr:zinc finger CCCH domain-containing protein ZFN-like isoform X3 [Prunus yedoensis var. nudiflora]
MDFDAGIPMSRAAAPVTDAPSLSPSLTQDAMWPMNLRSSETLDPGSYPERTGEPDCSYYIRTGLCRFGATCRFNHPPNRKLAIATARMKGEFPERIGQPECQYYLKTGTCKFGATCKFHHPRDKAGIAGRVALNILGYPLRPNEIECAYYLRTGQCKFGSTCKYHHPQPTNMRFHCVALLYILLSNLQLLLGVVSVPGWSAYSGQIGSVSSPESQQQPVGNSQIYGTSRQGEPENSGSQGTFSPYRSGSIPVGFYALQRENVFPERPGQPECQFYMKTGDCKFGAVCRFHHPRERLIPAPDCVLSPIGLPLRPGEPLCIFYSRYGICKFGPSCKFDHPMGIFTYNPNASSSADAPARRLLGSTSATTSLNLSSEGLVEAGSSNPRRLSLSEPRQISSGDDNIDTED